MFVPKGCQVRRYYALQELKQTISKRFPPGRCMPSGVILTAAGEDVDSPIVLMETPIMREVATGIERNSPLCLENKEGGKGGIGSIRASLLTAEILGISFQKNTCS